MAESADTPPPGEEPLRYGILGADTGTDGEKLAKYTGEVDWAYLQKPFEAGALLFVDRSLSLAEVGKAFAEDEVETVKSWRQAGDLVVPSAPHAAHWEASNARFLALVVSPFVLIQPIDDGAPR